jgi:hypothetical protein
VVLVVVVVVVGIIEDDDDDTSDIITKNEIFKNKIQKKRNYFVQKNKHMHVKNVISDAPHILFFITH